MVQLSVPAAAATRTPVRTDRAGLTPVTPVRADGAGLTPVSGLILAALAGASCKQGGFYAAAQWYLAIMLGLATLAALISLGPSRPGRSHWSVGELGSRIGISNGIGPFLALIGWTMLDAGLHGAVGSGCRLSLLVLAVLVVIADCRTLDAGSVELVLNSLPLLGAVIGLLGWLGVALHRSAWAIPGQGLWRASATLSYPNAAAALLAIIALLGLALRCADLPPGTTRWYGVLLTAVLAGVGATLSRGGLLALAVGTLV
nr:hypothetical protein [Actinomycetota bacterium]